MLTFSGEKRSFCDGVARRDFLKVGALSVGGLTLADLLAARAVANERRDSATKSPAGQGGALPTPSSNKAIIMIYLPGGPTHMDTYDMKPDAPAEFRGEFKPMKTNAAGVEICELMPRQAQIADKLAILRGIEFRDEHDAHMLTTGFPMKVQRPAFGCVVSKLRGSASGMPPYVSLMNRASDEQPEYLGPAHRPFVPSGPGLQNLSLNGVTLDRLEDRKRLLSSFDSIQREMDASGAMAGMDAFTAKALEMVTTPKAREAFDVSKEPATVRDRYGKDNNGFLQALRLVEAGVSVVTLATGGWDTHSKNFDTMRRQLPRVDQGLACLVEDLHSRGLDRDVAVVMWGEFGRTPRINKDAGRDHWSRAGFAVMAGGGFKTGQAIGATDERGERSLARPMTPSNVLATLYQHVGIDPAQTVPDNNGRPMHLLDDRETIPALIA